MEPNTIRYVVNPNAKLPQVLTRIKNGVTNYYVYGLALLTKSRKQQTATNTRSYISDYRGSTVALTDDNGNVTDRIEYSLYGLTTYHVGKSDTPFLFNGNTRRDDRPERNARHERALLQSVFVPVY